MRKMRMAVTAIAVGTIRFIILSAAGFIYSGSDIAASIDSCELESHGR